MLFRGGWVHQRGKGDQIIWSGHRVGGNTRVAFSGMALPPKASTLLPPPPPPPSPSPPGPSRKVLTSRVMGKACRDIKEPGGKGREREREGGEGGGGGRREEVYVKSSLRVVRGQLSCQRRPAFGSKVIGIPVQCHLDCPFQEIIPTCLK